MMLLAGLVLGRTGVVRAEERAPDPDGALSIHYRDDRLTVRANDVATTEVLEQLARSTGASIQGAQPDAPRISAEFEDVPLADALQRLLGKNSFNLVYGRNGLREIQLLGSGPALSVQPPPARVDSLPPSLAMLPGTLVLPFRNHPPVPVSGVLAQALGTKAATFDQLVPTAFHHENPQVRDAATKVCIQTIEAEPELKLAVEGALGGIDDQLLATVAQRLGGPNVEQFVGAISAHAREPAMRSHAAEVLERLRGQPKVPPTSGG